MGLSPFSSVALLSPAPYLEPETAPFTSSVLDETGAKLDSLKAWIKAGLDVLEEFVFSRIKSFPSFESETMGPVATVVPLL
jgi:hypothetical protein